MGTDKKNPAKAHGNSKASKRAVERRAKQLANQLAATAAKARETSDLVNAAAGSPATTAGTAWATKPTPAGGLHQAAATHPQPRHREAVPAAGVYKSPNETQRKAQRPDAAATAPREARRAQAGLTRATALEDAALPAPEPALTPGQAGAGGDGEREGAAGPTQMGQAGSAAVAGVAGAGAEQQRCAASPHSKRSARESQLHRLNRPQLIVKVLDLEEQLAAQAELAQRVAGETTAALAQHQEQTAQARSLYARADQLCAELLANEQAAFAALAAAEVAADEAAAVNACTVRELELQLAAATARCAGAAERAKVAAEAAVQQLEKENRIRLGITDGCSTRRLRWLRSQDWFRGCTQQVLDCIGDPDANTAAEPAEEPLQYLQTRSDFLPNHAYSARFISGALQHLVCHNLSLTGLAESLRTTPNVLLNQPNPNMTPCPATLRAYLLLAAEAFKEEIMKELACAVAVNVYYDSTKRDGRSWLFVGADFTLLALGQEPEVRSFVFGMRLSDGGTGRALADFLHNLICKEWGVPTEKVVFVTLDSCAANVGVHSGAVVLWSQMAPAATPAAAVEAPVPGGPAAAAPVAAVDAPVPGGPAAAAPAAAVDAPVPGGPAAAAPAAAAEAPSKAKPGKGGRAAKGKAKPADQPAAAHSRAIKFPVHCTNHVLHNALENAIKAAFGRSSTMSRSGSNSDVIFFLERIANLFRTRWSQLNPIVLKVCGGTPFPKPPDPQLTRWDIFCQVARWFMGRYNSVLTVLAEWTKALGNKCPADQVKLFKQLTEPSMLIQTSILAEFATVYSTSAQLWAEDKGGFRAFEIHGFFEQSLSQLAAAYCQPEEHFPLMYGLARTHGIGKEELTRLIQSFVGAYAEYMHQRCLFWWQPPYVFARLGAKQGAPDAARHILHTAFDNGALRPTWKALGLLSNPETLAGVKDLAAGGELKPGSTLHTFLYTYFAPLRISNAVSETALKVLKLPHIRQGQEPMVNAYASLKLGQPFKYYQLTDAHFCRARGRQQAAAAESGSSSSSGVATRRATPEEAARRLVESRQHAHFDCTPELLTAVYAVIAAATEEQPAVDSSASSKSEKEEAVRAVLLQDPSLQQTVQSGRITIAMMRDWLLARKLPKLPTNCPWAKAADAVLAAAQVALVEVEAAAQRKLEQSAQDWAVRAVWKQPQLYRAQLLAQDAAWAAEECGDVDV
ncbi:hypothetical protein HYH02_015407 [Chlamydomonas schloesseri]|uniref:Uncharacterized protein n=1 Tax=Chlamydomonas schloesseri TaxID=2026947 RepID=A0A835S8C1_9CHLO|nr:hypothetical protein HYH02_015407 [Chlamydomonas schloesseri]|eukprot:KAG2422632.1 hypothetical protein HYH02_015407 [Chlamydomonas schloesseri]